MKLDSKLQSLSVKKIVCLSDFKSKIEYNKNKGLAITLNEVYSLRMYQEYINHKSLHNRRLSLLYNQ